MAWLFMVLPVTADTVQFSSSTYFAGEGYVGSLIQIVRSGSAIGEASVEIVVTNGTAHQEADFTLATNVITFAAGQTNAGVILTVVSDGIAEPTETAILSLANPSAGLDLGNPKQATLTLYDSPLRVRFETSLISLSEADTSLVRLNVLRTGNLDISFTLDYYTTDTSAKAGEDYVAATGQLNFPAGVQNGIISLSLINDVLSESQESFRVYLTNATPWLDLRLPSAAVVSIQDDDLGYSICCTGNSIDESAGQAELSIYRQGSYNFSSTVDYFSVPGSAIPDLDYTPVSGTVTFERGTTRQVIHVPILNDSIKEANVTFRVVLTNASNGVKIGSTARQAIVTILDNDTGFRFVSTSVSVQETEAVAVLQVLRASDADHPMSVDFYTQPVSATPEADYNSVVGTLTFQPGEVSKEIRIPILNDGLRENNKTLRVILTNASPGDVIGTSKSAAIVIQDNDPGFSFQDSNYTISELSPEVFVYVNRGTDAPGERSVDYSVVPGTATPDADFTPVSGTLVFAANESIKSIRVPILNDALKETGETFRIVLSNPGTGTSLGTPNSTTVHIQDNDPGFSFGQSEYSVYEALPEIFVSVIRGTDIPGEVSVDFSGVAGTATPDVDYTAVSGTLVFAADELVKTIRIPILNDALKESQETFRIVLSNPSTGGSLGNPNSTTVHIQDNDLGFVFECNPLGPYCGEVPENFGEAKVDVVIRGDFNLTAPISVDFVTEPISATADVDFRSTSGTLTFALGETRKTIVIPLLNDGVPEQPEQFKVVLRNPVGVPLGNPTEFSITIQDNERGYRIEQSVGIGQLNVREKSGGVPVIIYREGEFATTSSVDFRIDSRNANGDLVGTATPNVDFVPTSGTVTFGPGETNKVITLQLLDDAAFELNETLFITLSNTTGGAPIAESERLVVLLDNERNPLRVDPDFKPEVQYTRSGSGIGQADLNLQTLPDGRIVMVTPLWSLNGEDGVAVVRLLHDGRLDPTFIPVPVTDDSVSGLALQANGEVLVGSGPKFKMGGKDIRHVARLKADGAIDPSFVAQLTNEPSRVISLAVQANNQVLVATEEGRLRRLNADGSLDGAFGPVVAYGVRRIVLDSAKRILLWGFFGDINGQARPGLARLLPEGLLDPSFLGAWEFNQIDAFELAAGDSVLVRFDGDQGVRLARITPDGKLDPVFQPFGQQGKPNIGIEFFTPEPQGKVMVSQTQTGSARIVSRLNQDGTTDDTLLPGTYTVQTTGAWISSFSLTREPDGDLLVKGDLTAVNGQRRAGLARLLVNAPTPRLEPDPTATELTETNGTAIGRLIRAGSNTVPYTVHWVTDGGTAKPGVDYVAAAGDLTFGAGESEREFPLQLIDNTEPDDDRSVRLRITTAEGVELPFVEFTILNDDLGFTPGNPRKFPNGRVLVSVTGHRNKNNVRLQISTDLHNWDDWTTLDNTSQILDGDAPSFERRFFRLAHDPTQ